jgi:hypothetical protein
MSRLPAAPSVWGSGTAGAPRTGFCIGNDCPGASFRPVSLSRCNEMTFAASGLTRGPAWGIAREACPLLVDVSHLGSATRRCAWGFSGVAIAWILRPGLFLNDRR